MAAHSRLLRVMRTNTGASIEGTARTATCSTTTTTAAAIGAPSVRARILSLAVYRGPPPWRMRIIPVTRPSRHPDIIQTGVGRSPGQELVRELGQVRVGRGQLLEHDHIAILEIILNACGSRVPSQKHVRIGVARPLERGLGR